MSKIVIFVVYFGRWPQYFPLFLESCRRNPSIDFLFISDCGLSDNVESVPNCRYMDFDLERFSQLATIKIGIPVDVAMPYKLCDFKPLFGTVFSDQINGYDFWGYSDIDLILGNVSKFVHSLHRYDLFFVRKRWTTGSLFFVRNIAQCNSLYRESRDWEIVVTEPRSFAFDECAGLWSQLQQGCNLEELDSPVDSFTHVVLREQRAGRIKAHFEDLAHESVPVLSLYDGTVKDNYGSEFMSFHYITAKSRWLFIYPQWGAIPEKYYITKYGFFRDLPTIRSTVWTLLSANAAKQVCKKLNDRVVKAGNAIRNGDVRFVIDDVGRRLGFK